jgi:hypothetical protein
MMALLTHHPLKELRYFNMPNPKHDQLIKDYPRALSNVRCGIYYNEGWHTLINSLCHLIEQEINQMPLELQDQFKVDQIKQKFGSLRFYMNRTTPYMDGAIQLAEYMSNHTCEFCGNKGSSKQVGGWCAVLCDACHQIKIEEQKSRR